ncbi:MAG: hypothetical protein ACJAZV_001811 [Roseivirga sp.]|jgi:hypothetical protein
MKTMTCKQLGGACNLEFHAETFNEIAEMSKLHGMEMYKIRDADHLKAMTEMQAFMQSPVSMRDWLESKMKAFDDLPENE